MAIADWQLKAQKKRNEAAAKIPESWQLSTKILSKISTESSQDVTKIPRECGILTTKEIEITEKYDATDLVSMMTAGQLSSSEVTLAFCKRAAIAQQLTHCLTETFFDKATERARQLDGDFQRSGKAVGPLHGLPISVKDSFNIKGIHSTIGFVSFISHPPASHNSALIDVLLAAGAVLYVKTNIPQTMMTPDSHNNVFGRVLNPRMLSLTAGGSSGGEGALLAMRGAPLGIGTDIAGSVRIPGLCNGVFAFKPSTGRIPYGGQASGGRKGLVGFGPSAGPLTNTARDAQLLLKTVFDSQCTELDAMAIAVPWLEPERQEKLVLGLMPEDPDLPLHPPMQRALAEAVAIMERAGHTIVELPQARMPVHRWSKLAMKYFTMDPARTAFENIAASGEPEVPSLKVSFPAPGTFPEPTLERIYDMNASRGRVIEDMRHLFVEYGLDALVGPAYQSCAVPHDTFGEPAYTVFANLIDYPACVLPFRKADKTLDAGFKREVLYQPPYEADKVEGAPCHIQLIARNLKDERLIRAAIVIEELLKGA